MAVPSLTLSYALDKGPIESFPKGDCFKFTWFCWREGGNIYQLSAYTEEEMSTGRMTVKRLRYLDRVWIQSQSLREGS
ncbi:Uncharacterized protein DAT39_006409 [Clarias magur]|uniref:Uncharacterized protein n=1 Tax=Clarias magur TaxID=1594786 RepID=A0A8J4UCU4_CLAMG|nr:Uncharacterized protein DAT39_006409 [Clarias magur]